MRFDRNIVHPALFAATDKMTNQAWTGVYGMTPERMKAYTEHQSVWWQEYKGGCAIWTLGLVGGLAAIQGVISLVGMSGEWPEVFLLIAFIAWMILGYQANRRNLSSRELKVLLPALELTPIQRTYAEALIAAADLKLPESQFREIVGQLNRLLDEEARLVALHEQGLPVTPTEIEAERAAIREKLDQIEDPVTRAALERSLELADARYHAATELSLVGQRVEAQTEMILQAARGIRDSLQRMKSVPSASGPAIDLEALRRSVDQAQQHSQALEKAVEEVRTLA